MKQETRAEIEKFMDTWCPSLQPLQRPMFVSHFLRVVGIHGKDVGDEVMKMVKDSMPTVTAKV
jgi:hypothetical protein